MHSMAKILLRLFVVICLLQIAASKPRRRTAQRSCQSYKEYFNSTSGKCEACSTCGPGRGVARACQDGSVNADTLCEDCTAGVSFSTGRSHSGAPCYACSTCGGRSVVKKCTPSSDTVCGECPLGTYWDEIWSKCRTCSYCFSETRQAGLYTVKACIRKEIPSTHWCIQLSSPPHSAPLLRSTRRPNGSIYFYTDSDANILDLDTSQKGVLEYEQFLIIDEESQKKTKKETETIEEGWLDHTVENPPALSEAPSNVHDSADFTDASIVVVKQTSYDVRLLVACSIVSAAFTFLCTLFVLKQCSKSRKLKAYKKYKPIYRPPPNTNRCDQPSRV